MRRNSARTSAKTATIAPSATEAIAVANVTWFAVTPAEASRRTAGRRRFWKRGLRSYRVIRRHFWGFRFGVGMRLTRPRLPNCRSFNSTTISSTAVFTALRFPCR